jgi:hypothetical protein
MVAYQYNPSMYAEIKEWWKGHSGWESIPESMLPKTGFVVGDENSLFCVVFIYEDSSTSVAMMEWLVTNPTNTARESLKAIKLLLERVGRYADDNKRVLFTTLLQPSLSKLYERVGFVCGDTGMTNMTRIGEWA